MFLIIDKKSKSLNTETTLININKQNKVHKMNFSNYSLKLRKNKKCSLCNNPAFRKWDETIASREHLPRDIAMSIADSDGLIISEQEVFKHIDHLYYKEIINETEKEVELLEQDILKSCLDDVSDITILRARINKLRVSLNELEENDETGSQKWLELNKALQELIDKKNRIEGNISDNKVEVNIDLNEFWTKLRRKTEGEDKNVDEKGKKLLKRKIK